MSDDVRREEKRLRTIFHRALLLALAAPVVVPIACIASNGGTSSSGAGGSGATGSGGGASTSDVATVTSGGGQTTAAATTGSGSGSGGGDAGIDVDCTPAPFTPTPADACGAYLRLPCGVPANAQPTDTCYLALVDCSNLCPAGFFNCHTTGESCVDGGGIVKDSKGGVDLDCATCPNGVGRIPAGLARARMARAGSALGGYFAAAAHLEAASVHAFRRLYCELSAHGAPERLLRASRRAERDEVRHARVTARLARRFGGKPARARVNEVGERSLDAIAVENAVEGCVRETFGALMASFQAANAGDAEIARVMAGIAKDETKHAALSWAVARWASPRLDDGAREQIRARCRETVEELRREAGSAVAEELGTSAGVPNGEQQRAMLGMLEEQLWSALT